MFCVSEDEDQETSSFQSKINLELLHEQSKQTQYAISDIESKFFPSKQPLRSSGEVAMKQDSHGEKKVLKAAEAIQPNSGK